MWYIWHNDTQTPENGEAYFGPFSDDEIVERVNDAYADMLAACGELEERKLEPEYAKSIYINPREFWMTQLAEYDE